MPNIDTTTVTREDIKQAETKDLVDLYNRITGKSIKKFAARSNAEAQTWKAIQQLAPGENAWEKPEVPKKKTSGKRDNYEHRVIQVLAKENPKRPGSCAHKKFEVLMKHDGKTIKELKEQEGKYSTLDDEAGWPATELRWALKLGLVKILNGNSDSKAA